MLPSIRHSGSYSLKPKNYPEAMLCLKKETREKEVMKKERDYAIETKSWISGRKTATAMNTASQLSKKVKKLENQIASMAFYPMRLF